MGAAKRARFFCALSKKKKKMQHMFLVLEDVGLERSKRFLQQELPQRLQNERTKKFCLHYPESVKLMRYLPRHPNLKLEPMKMRATKANVEKIAKRLENVEWVGGTAQPEGPVQQQQQQQQAPMMKRAAPAAPPASTSTGVAGVMGAMLQRRVVDGTRAEREQRADKLWRKVFLETSVYDADMEKLRGGVEYWLYINLEKSVNRREHMEKMLEKMPWQKAVRVPAVSLQTLDESLEIGRAHV